MIALLWLHRMTPFIVIFVFWNLFASGSCEELEDKNTNCRGLISGDCDPYTCSGSCESKYIRFFDKDTKIDRTVKTCVCQQERMCSVLGMHAFSGCKSYSALRSIGQKFVRYWSMNARDKKNRVSNDPRTHLSDKMRHEQLLNGNSRFCCRTTIQKRYALQLKSSASSSSPVCFNPTWLSIVLPFSFYNSFHF